MKLYNYDQATGAFLNETDAEPDPMVPGEFLVPAFATQQPPPPEREGKRPFFDQRTSRWTLKDAERAADPAAPGPVEVPFPVKVASWRKVVKQHLDVVAIACDFDSIDEAVSYADEPAVPAFQALGQALRGWRSRVWHAFDDGCRQISAGNTPEPQSDAELIALLVPPFELPAPVAPEPEAPAEEAEAPPQP